MTAEYPRDLGARILPTIDELLVREKPTADQLAMLLEVAWQATQLEEEGRATVFAIAFADPAHVALNHTPATFVGSRPFDMNAIAKLAPAAHFEQTMIAVWPQEDGELRIWGLLHVGDPTFAIDLANPPGYLRIVGSRPGALDVAVGLVPLVRYANGVAHVYKRQETDITAVLRSSAYRARELGVGQGALAHEFERLAERLVRAGHGGCFLVFDTLSEKQALPVCVSIPEIGRFESVDRTLQTAFVNHEKAISGALTKEDRPRAERHHRDALDFVARLANVDGAVVMHSDLSVAGFGATVTLDDALLSAPPGIPVVEADPRDPSKTKRFDLSRVGHRHKAAIHYCAAQLRAGHRPETKGMSQAFAIVGSQDGTLSLVSIVGASVQVLRPFVLSQTIIRGVH